MTVVPTPTADEFAIETRTVFTKCAVDNPTSGVKSMFKLDPDKYALYVPIPGELKEDKLPVVNCPYSKNSTSVPLWRTLISSTS